MGKKREDKREETKARGDRRQYNARLIGSEGYGRCGARSG